MAYSTMPRTPTIYKDFEPAYEWSQEQNLHTLLIYLPDFKKEDIKVQIDNYGNLRVEGERHLEKNQRLRFIKDFEMPDDCNVNEIKANFSDGLLYIWLPKLITKEEEPEEQKPKITPKPEEQKMNNQKKETDAKPSTRVQEEPEKRGPKKDHQRVDDDRKKEELSLLDDKSAMKEKEKEVGNGMKENVSLALEKSQQRKLLINVVVSLMVLVGLAMYVTFKMSKS